MLPSGQQNEEVRQEGKRRGFLHESEQDFPSHTALAAEARVQGQPLCREHA